MEHLVRVHVLYTFMYFGPVSDLQYFFYKRPTKPGLPARQDLYTAQWKKTYKYFMKTLHWSSVCQPLLIMKKGWHLKTCVQLLILKLFFFFFIIYLEWRFFLNEHTGKIVWNFNISHTVMTSAVFCLLERPKMYTVTLFCKQRLPHLAKITNFYKCNLMQTL